VSLPSPKSLLQRLGLRPKKSLGQHFLLHPHQARRIVDALDATPRDVVVEIGPGLGALTVLLAETAREVVALEVDAFLADYLRRELFAAAPHVRIIKEDVLKFDLAGLSREAGQALKVAGNLPYHITSPLLFKLIEEKAAVARAVLMVQEEVGERLLARPGGKDYGILSVLAQYHFTLERLFSLSPANFYPPPQVRSVVLRLNPGHPDPRARDESLFRRVVKTAFAKRRKTLKNTLAAQAGAFGLQPEELLAMVQEAGIDPGRRAETLSVAHFVELSNRIREQGDGERAGEGGAG
jgi:16S rRNA (adenine1518-N6/adenine1519-N6)-dimethyltransferase